MTCFHHALNIAVLIIWTLHVQMMITKFVLSSIYSILSVILHIASSFKLHQPNLLC